MEVVGYIAALLIGISLGLIGGGGSILTVPVLVYLFGVSPITATSYSLFVVGSTSLVGTVNNYRKGLVDYHTALLFGITSVLSVYITRKIILPLIPPHFAIGGISIDFSILTMVMFAVLMVLASVSMIRNRKSQEISRSSHHPLGLLILYGIGIGLVTGFLGAGGGFLLIPVLVLILKIPMRKAIGTSLMIIALNSLIGFAGDAGHFKINWMLLLTVSGLAVGGVMLGGLLAKRIQGEHLKKGFGWFVLVMGIYIIVREALT